MKKLKTNVLLAIRQGEIGGGETHVLDLVHAMNTARYNIFVLSFTSGPMVERLKEIGVPCYVIHTVKPFDFSVWGKVKKLLVSLNIELVHAHGTRANSNTFWATKSLSLPFIYTVHGWSFHQNQHPLVYKSKVWIEKLLTRQADTVINVSKSNQLDGVTKFQMKRSVVIYNGISQEKFNPQKAYNDIRKEFNISGSKIVVGYMVRMTEQKDPHTMIRAIQLAMKQSKELVFLMVGDGDLRESTEALAKKLGVMDHVIFTGFRTDIPDILNAIDIYCLPSLWEGLPIGLLEAMGMKKAVIATAVDGSVEVIKNGKTGLLIDKNNPEDLAKKLLYLASNKKEMAILGANASTYIKASFNVFEMTRKTEQIYQKVLEKQFENQIIPKLVIDRKIQSEV
jgi:glycosyltransferase involved in cell wall biosynthesis